MTDLKVDEALLAASERALARLKSEFRGAMREFSGNMDYNRRKLSAKLQECGEKIGNAREAWEAADEELAGRFASTTGGAR